MNQPLPGTVCTQLLFLPAGGYRVGARRYAHFSHRHAAVAGLRLGWFLPVTGFAVAAWLQVGSGGDAGEVDLLVVDGRSVGDPLSHRGRAIQELGGRERAQGAAGEVDRGILVCGSGIGMAIALVVDLMKLSFLIDVQRRDKAGEPYDQ